MKFKVLKSSMDGISGGASSFDSIDDVLKEISYHKGWDSLKQLHAAIKKWAKEARPGSVFTTQVTAIITVACDYLNRQDDICHYCGYEEGLDYGDLDPIEGSMIQQECSCPGCGKRWMDRFALIEQAGLAPRKESK